MMLRLMSAVAGLAAPFLFVAPAFAATPQQKMETCTFGADDQKLAGTKRKAFLSKCMSNADSPRGKPVTPKPKPQ